MKRQETRDWLAYSTVIDRLSSAFKSSRKLGRLNSASLSWLTAVVVAGAVISRHSVGPTSRPHARAWGPPASSFDGLNRDGLERQRPQPLRWSSPSSRRSSASVDRAETAPRKCASSLMTGSPRELRHYRQDERLHLGRRLQTKATRWPVHQCLTGVVLASSGENVRHQLFFVVRHVYLTL